MKEYFALAIMVRGIQILLSKRIYTENRQKTHLYGNTWGNSSRGQCPCFSAHSLLGSFPTIPPFFQGSISKIGSKSLVEALELHNFALQQLRTKSTSSTAPSEQQINLCNRQKRTRLLLLWAVCQLHLPFSKYCLLAMPLSAPYCCLFSS